MLDDTQKTLQMELDQFRQYCEEDIKNLMNKFVSRQKVYANEVSQIFLNILIFSKMLKVWEDSNEKSKQRLQ